MWDMGLSSLCCSLTFFTLACDPDVSKQHSDDNPMSHMSFLMSQISTFISRPHSGRWLGVIAVTTAIFSSGCGGGGAGSPPVSSPPPPQPAGPGTPTINESGGLTAGYKPLWGGQFDPARFPD